MFIDKLIIKKKFGCRSAHPTVTTPSIFRLTYLNPIPRSSGKAVFVCWGNVSIFFISVIVCW